MSHGRDAGGERIKGVFSSEANSWIGAGATKRKVVIRRNYFVEERTEGFVKVQMLGDNFLPTGAPVTIKKEELVAKYIPETDIYLQKTLPAMKAVAKTLARADRLRSQGEVYGAEFEYKNALRMDTQNVRAMFGLALTYMDRDEQDKAQHVLQSLIKLEEAFDVENKYLFNEFGIKLRKARMFEPALSYYAKAFKLCGNDEHLLYNMARIYYDMLDYKRAAVFLKKALQINPGFSHGREFARVLMAKLKAAC
ncbi:MAG: tetratricopeptide repeat protein [Desulfovibrionaceae bacterium]